MRYRVSSPQPIIVYDEFLFLHKWLWYCPLCGDRCTFSHKTRTQAVNAGRRHIRHRYGKCGSQ